MKLIIVDDHAIVSDGLEAILKSQDLNVLRKFTSGNFALAYLKQEKVDLMITDYSMPDMDGLTLVKKAKALAPDIKIIVLSMHDEVTMVREMFSAGVEGYVLKKYAHQELMAAIEMVGNGRQYWSAEVSKALLNSIHQQDSADTPITEREMEVLKLLAQQLTSKQIADRLFIGERTVDTHRKNLMRKTGASNAVGLVRYAYDNKLI
jgi:DNA-binding NarL/FixJ family response regulator